MTRTLTKSEWEAEAERRFGPDANGWRFVCPACGHVASVALAAGGGRHATPSRRPWARATTRAVDSSDSTL